MALIYRSILESQRPELVADAPSLTRSWLRWKLGIADLELPEPGANGAPAPGCELVCSAADGSEGRAYRATLFEERDADQVKTTFIALEDGDRRWAWVDLERWTETPYQPSFVPIAPGIVGTLLRQAALTRGGFVLGPRYRRIEKKDVADLVSALLEEDREIPVVVVSPTAAERDGDISPAEERAREIYRRVAGIGSVSLLLPGATGELSRALSDELGEGFDVHSGAVRIYLPGLGGEKDRPERHRYIPGSTLRDRPAATAGQIVGSRLVGASTQQAPPSAWRRVHRAMLDGSGASSDTDISQILEEDLRAAETERDAALRLNAEFEETNESQRTAIDSLQDQVDQLAGRIAYLSQVAERAQPGSSHGHAPVEQEPPEWCSDVVDRADQELELVSMHPSCRAPASDLDQHCVPSWAKRAWRSLRALQAYAEGKRDGTASGDFKTFCEQSGSPRAIPSSWVARHEGQVTRTNERFRRLRTLPADPSATPDGSDSVFMEAHIRIEDGGTPCPRIHFYDDTSGRTGRVHVGWFGDHLDSAAKS